MHSLYAFVNLGRLYVILTNIAIIWTSSQVIIFTRSPFYDIYTNNRERIEIIDSDFRKI